MPPPSQLSIATSSVNRLVKEEASYHKEQKQQEAYIAKLEADNGDEYEIKQNKQALAETHKVFPSLRSKIKDAVAKLEAQLSQEEGSSASAEEVQKAKEAITAANSVVQPTS